MGSSINALFWFQEKSKYVFRHRRSFLGQKDEPFLRLEVRTVQSNQFTHKTGTLIQGASSCIK